MGGPRRGGYQPPVYYQPSYQPRPVTHYAPVTTPAPVTIPQAKTPTGAPETVNLDQWKRDNQIMREKLTAMHSMIQTANTANSVAKDLKEQVPGIGALSGLLGGNKTPETKTTTPATPTSSVPKSTEAAPSTTGHATVKLDDWKRQNEEFRAKLLEKHKMIQNANAFNNAAKDLKEQIPGIGALSGLLGGSKAAETKTTTPAETPTTSTPQTTGPTTESSTPAGSQETSAVEDGVESSGDVEMTEEPVSTEPPEPEPLRTPEEV